MQMLEIKWTVRIGPVIGLVDNELRSCHARGAYNIGYHLSWYVYRLLFSSKTRDFCQLSLGLYD